MKPVICFSNPGPLDPRLWQTFGVSIKQGDSPIGQFGTGLKYAIAVLMREGRSLRIDTGGDRYEFGVTETEFRGSPFEQITCNGATLPFTTHLGSTWELWQAYRELYSNCLDEGGDIDGGFETNIHAEIGDVKHADVFLDTTRRVLTKTPGCEVYSGRSKVLYYRGIRAGETNRESLYTYNILDAALTEDRTFAHLFQVYQRISETVLSTDNTDFAQSFLLQSKHLFEERVDFDYTSLKPGQTAVDVVNQFRKDDCYLHKGMFESVAAHLGPACYTIHDMDDRERRVLERASEFCDRIGFPIEHPVVKSNDLGKGKLGMADPSNNTIYLSGVVLSQGVKQVASTLIEENLHLTLGYQDCTYQMQSYLFDQVVTMGERLTGEVL